MIARRQPFVVAVAVEQRHLELSATLGRPIAGPVVVAVVAAAAARRTTVVVGRSCSGIVGLVAVAELVVEPVAAGCWRPRQPMSRSF